MLKSHGIMSNWDNLKLVYINGNRLPCVNLSLILSFSNYKLILLSLEPAQCLVCSCILWMFVWARTYGEIIALFAINPNLLIQYQYLT